MVSSSVLLRSCGDVHCVVLGDEKAGKSKLLSAYETLDSNRTPSVFIEYSTSKILDNTAYQFVFSGVSGQEHYRNLRLLSYLRPTGVFLVCFSVIDVCQFMNAKDSWVDEIRAYAPGSPFLLVGTHSDLRRNRSIRRKLRLEGKSVVQRAEAEKAARSLGCKYIECSATTHDNVRQVFDEAIKTAMKSPVMDTLRRSCQVM